MPTTIILGSRGYAPLVDVRALAAEKRDAGETVQTWGTSPIADTIVQTWPDTKRLAGAPDRSNLVEAGLNPDTAIVIFAAKDPETRKISEGTAATIRILKAAGIEPDVRSGILTSKQMVAYDAVERELRVLPETPRNHYRRRMERMNKAAVALYGICNDLELALFKEDVRIKAEGGTPATDDRWIRNLHKLELMRQLLDAAEQVSKDDLIAQADAAAREDARIRRLQEWWLRKRQAEDTDLTIGSTSQFASTRSPRRRSATKSPDAVSDSGSTKNVAQKRSQRDSRKPIQKAMVTA